MYAVQFYILKLQEKTASILGSHVAQGVIVDKRIYASLREIDQKTKGSGGRIFSNKITNVLLKSR